MGSLKLWCRPVRCNLVVQCCNQTPEEATEGRLPPIQQPPEKAQEMQLEQDSKDMPQGGVRVDQRSSHMDVHPPVVPDVPQAGLDKDGPQSDQGKPWGKPGIRVFSL